MSTCQEPSLLVSLSPGTPACAGSVGFHTDVLEGMSGHGQQWMGPGVSLNGCAGLEDTVESLLGTQGRSTAGRAVR